MVALSENSTPFRVRECGDLWRRVDFYVKGARPQWGPVFLFLYSCKKHTRCACILCMERFFDRMGLWSIVAILAVFVVLYSLWGASLIKAERSGLLGQAASTPLSTNL